MQILRIKENVLIMPIALLLGIITIQYSATATSGNGFDLSNSVIPQVEILQGGPPRDGIPAISNPKLVAGSQASYI
ncbi:MAG: hypothetical protein GY770_25720, partial [Aestuariibacter sp.]|nr:hypothetical protein [Aestuariibacter sp.]